MNLWELNKNIIQPLIEAKYNGTSKTKIGNEFLNKLKYIEQSNALTYDIDKYIFEIKSNLHYKTIGDYVFDCIKSLDRMKVKTNTKSITIMDTDIYIRITVDETKQI